MNIAAIQHDIAWEQRDVNLPRYATLVTQAVDTGADVVLFTEMFAVGFSMNTTVTAEAEDGPTVAWMVEQATQHGITLGGSVPLTRGDIRPNNTFVLARPNGHVEMYNKIHPFSFSGEDQYFAPGDVGHITDINGLRVGISVCYDLRFAPLYYTRAPLVDVELVVASWPAARREHWMTLARARAIENQTYMVALNRVGSGGGLTYAGDSRIIDPTGKIIAEANDTETILTASLDAELVASTRDSFPVFDDRRDTYPTTNG